MLAVSRHHAGSSKVSSRARSAGSSSESHRLARSRKEGHGSSPWWRAPLRSSLRALFNPSIPLAALPQHFPLSRLTVVASGEGETPPPDDVIAGDMSRYNFLRSSDAVDMEIEKGDVVSAKIPS